MITSAPVAVNQLPRPVARTPVAGFVGAFVVMLALLALFYLCWQLHWTHESLVLLRMVPRWSVLAISLVGALIMQGPLRREEDGLFNTTTPAGWFTLAGLLCAGGAVGLFYSQGLPDHVWPLQPGDDDASTVSPHAAARMALWLLHTASAIALGSRMGLLISAPFHLATLVVCSAAGDVWLGSFNVPDSSELGNPVRWLLLTWPGRAQTMVSPASWSDILILSATVCGARRLGYAGWQCALGALIGYAFGVLLAQEPSPGWRGMVMVMAGSGALAGCWPELKISAWESVRIFACGALLLTVLLGTMAARAYYKRMKPELPKQPDALRYRGTT